MSRPNDTSRQPNPQVRGATTENFGASTQHNRPPAEASNRSTAPEIPAPEIPAPEVRQHGHRADPRLRKAEQETRRLARAHYENFLVASLLLPRRLHQPFFNVYAFCRTADDLADESASRQLALSRLEAFRRELDATFEGNPSEGLFLALGHTVEQYQLAKKPFDDLLSAFRQDQHKTRYRTLVEIVDYCQRSANPVGRIVLALAGSDDDENGKLSDSICTGLQLANFLQDVASDYQRGRIYLPADQMDRFGVDEAMFGHDRTPAPMRAWLSDECERAEGFLRAGLPLADRVPRWFAGDVRLFAHGGLATLHAIRRIDFDVLRVRPTVGKTTQLSLLVRAAFGLL